MYNRSLKLLKLSLVEEKQEKIKKAKREVARITSYGEQDCYTSYRKASTLLDNSGQYLEQGYTESRYLYPDYPRRLLTHQASRNNKYSPRTPPPQGRQIYYSEDSSVESTPEDTGRSADGRAYADSVSWSGVVYADSVSWSGVVVLMM
jgi:hypothetical protein